MKNYLLNTKFIVNDTKTIGQTTAQETHHHIPLNAWYNMIWYGIIRQEQEEGLQEAAKG